MTLSRHSSCISLPGQYLPLIFPTAICLCGAQGRIRIGHTCILFIVKSKRGSTEKQVMQSRSKRCKCMSGWMDGWIWLTPWGNGFSLSNHPYFFFLRHSYPLFLSLFFGHASLACHLLSFWATIIWLYFISGMFYERDHQDMEHLLCGMNGWWCQFPV